MKTTHFSTIVIALLFSVCPHIIYSQESILNHVSHIEDSLILKVPEVPRLCDDLKTEKKYVDIGGCKLYVEIDGQGTPLLLIPGGPGDTHHTFHPWLSKAAENFQVIYFDPRGCGLSDYNPGEGYSFEQAIDDMDKLRKALNIDKWIVLGHSYGGSVAQYYSIKYPENVIGQILVGSVPMVNSEILNGSRENDYLNAEEKKKKDEILTLFRQGKINLTQYLYNKDINGDWKREHFFKPTNKRLAQMVTYDIHYDNAFNSDYRSYNFENVFNNCPLPTLIIEGKYDLIWKAKKAELVKQIHPNGQLIYFEKAGHFVFNDEPENFVATVSRWANQLETPNKKAISTWKKYTSELLDDQITLINNSKVFIKMIKNEGIEKAKKYYIQFKNDNPDKQLFFEPSLNALGYEYFFADKLNEAIEVFKLNVKEFPESWNVYDSLGEAYLKIGDKQKAKENYLKSVELNPENENGKQILNEL